MEYQIQYDRQGKSRRRRPAGKWQKNCVHIVLLVGAAAILLWSADVNVREIISAADMMADALKQGSGVKDAFSEFCLDILRGTVQ